MKARTFGFFGRFAVAMAVLALAGCGSDSKQNNPPVTVSTFNGAEYGVLKDGSLTRSETEIRGTGSLIFKNPLNDEDNNFALTFTLEDGGSITLVPNAVTGLTSGAEVVFGRQGDNLTIRLVNGQDVLDLAEDFINLPSAKGAISLDVDVHEHGHVVFWIGDEEQEFAFDPNKGQFGKFWGLRLENATVTQAVVRKAKEEH